MANNSKIIGFQSGHDVAYCVLENGIPIIHEELEIQETEPVDYKLVQWTQILNHLKQ